jgi:hypothetical protein
MSMQVTASTSVPRQPVCSFPSESFGYFHVLFGILWFAGYVKGFLYVFIQKEAQKYRIKGSPPRFYLKYKAL